VLKILNLAQNLLLSKKENAFTYIILFPKMYFNV